MRWPMTITIERSGRDMLARAIVDDTPQGILVPIEEARRGELIEPRSGEGQAARLAVFLLLKNMESKEQPHAR